MVMVDVDDNSLHADSMAQVGWLGLGAGAVLHLLHRVNSDNNFGLMRAP